VGFHDVAAVAKKEGGGKVLPGAGDCPTSKKVLARGREDQREIAALQGALLEAE
jgi:hypothetical protein